MNYETPKLTALTPAIDAIQDHKGFPGVLESVIPTYEELAAYADWE